MMARWPDGSMVAEDPHAAARRLDAETLGWRIWFGDSTGHFFGVQLGAPVMVEAKTTDDLIEQIAAKTSAAHSPAPSPPRGWAAPARAGRRGLRM